MKYLVGRKEIYEQMVEIEANSESEAIQKVADGEGLVLDNQLAFAGSMDIDTWIVYDETEVL